MEPGDPKSTESGKDESSTLETSTPPAPSVEDGARGPWRRGEAILAFSLRGKPETWSRSRGGPGQPRYNDPRLKSWEGVLRETAKQEADIWGLDLPTTQPLWVEIGIAFPNRSAWRMAGDPDNYAKAILDALRDTVWEDDRVKNVPVVQFKAWYMDFAGGTEAEAFISVYRCELA